MQQTIIKYITYVFLCNLILVIEFGLVWFGLSARTGDQTKKPAPPHTHN